MQQITNHLPTAELQALDAAHHMHPFSTQSDLAKVGARVITSASGVRLKDSEGQEILDAMAGLWCVNIGYGREELAQVAARQIRELPYYNTFFQTTHVPAIALSAKLAELAPGDLNHVFYAGSGSEANDTNLRMVRTYWEQMGKPGKSIVISRWNAYHGSSVGSGSLGGMKGIHSQGGLPIPGIEHIDQPHWWAEGGDLSPEEFGLERARQLEAKIDQLGEDRVAAFIAEPVQGAGGVIIAPDTYWPEVMRICRERDILFIADEVMTGWGRTGTLLACEQADVVPDILCLSKGLTGGAMPLAVTMASEPIWDAHYSTDRTRTFYHSSSYTANPLACAAAVANLAIWREEPVRERVATLAEMQQTHLDALSGHAMVRNARRCGTIAALELGDPAGSYLSELGPRLLRRFREADLLLRPLGNTVYVMPPYCIEDEDLARIWAEIGAAADDLATQ